MSQKNIMIVGISILIFVVLIGTMTSVAYTLSRTTSKSQNNSSSNSSSEYMTMKDDNSMMGMNHEEHNIMKMNNNVKDDQSFLQNMIPHHEEAVSSSKQIVNSTKDSELKVFAQGVIDTQTKEINQMKTWYKEWFGKDYVSDNNYTEMMGGMRGKTDQELDKQYVYDMIMHHREAINMATKIKIITTRPELNKLGDDIIKTQGDETDFLMGWLRDKYGEDSSVMNNSME